MLTVHRTSVPRWAWVLVILVCAVGCEPNVDKQEPASEDLLGYEKGDPSDGPDRRSDRRTTDGTIGPPAIGSGAMTLKWPDGKSVVLSNWSMTIDIMQGAEGTDSAEISLAATTASMSDHVTFTLSLPAITPETLKVPDSHRIAEGAGGKANSLSIWSAGQGLVTRSGRVEIASYEAGKAVGSFVAKVALDTRSQEAIEVRGDFEGFVHFACNALTSQRLDMRGGATMGGKAGPSWTSVGIDNPFCSAYF